MVNRFLDVNSQEAIVGCSVSILDHNVFDLSALVLIDLAFNARFGEECLRFIELVVSD